MHERIIEVDYNPDLKELTRKKRVCAYARVSSDREEAFHSLSAQISYYQTKIAEHPDWEFVEVFSDRGITGTKEKREGFQRMLTACYEGKIDIILAKSISRFARNAIILLEVIRELKRLNISVLFEEENIDTLSAEGELMISVLAARAQEESRQASENQKWRIQKSFQQGIPVVGNCLGYRMVKHQLLIEESEEQVVQRIFKMYLSGMGKTAIAKKLNEEGVRTRLNKSKWTPASIEPIIRNEKYCGDLILQKWYISDYIEKKKTRNKGEKPMYRVRDNHDAIITREDFAKTKNEIERRAAKHSPKNIGGHHAFSKLIRCSCCGKKFTRNIGNAGTQYAKPTWACQTAILYGKDFCGATQRIPESILISKTCEVLEIPELDESVLRDRIKEIIVPQNNTLIYIFTDGNEKTVEWKHRSRRESWTPEMKEKARQRTKLWHQQNKKERSI